MYVVSLYTVSVTMYVCVCVSVRCDWGVVSVSLEVCGYVCPSLSQCKTVGRYVLHVLAPSMSATCVSGNADECVCCRMREISVSTRRMHAQSLP